MIESILAVLFIVLFILAAITGVRDRRNKLDADQYLAEKYRQQRRR